MKAMILADLCDDGNEVKIKPDDYFGDTVLITIQEQDNKMTAVVDRIELLTFLASIRYEKK